MDSIRRKAGPGVGSEASASGGCELVRDSLLGTVSFSSCRSVVMGSTTGSTPASTREILQPKSGHPKACLCEFQRVVLQLWFVASFVVSLTSTPLHTPWRLPPMMVSSTAPWQLPSMPLAPEYGARPHNASLALLGPEDHEEVEKRQEALQLFERLFGSSNNGNDEAGGGGGGAITAVRVTSSGPSGSARGAKELSTPVADTSRVGCTVSRKPGSDHDDDDDDEYDEYDVELRSSYTEGAERGQVVASPSSRPESSCSVSAAGRGKSGGALRVVMLAKPAVATAGFATHKPALLARKSPPEAAATAGSNGGRVASHGSMSTTPSSAAAVTSTAVSVRGLGAEKLSLGSPRLVVGSPRDMGSPGLGGGAGVATGPATGGAGGSRLARPVSAGRSAPRKLASNLVPRTGGKMLS